MSHHSSPFVLRIGPAVFVGLFTFVLLTNSPATAFGAPFGINAHVPGSAVLDEITAAGIGWIRIDFVWAMVEQERDEYDWSRYDRLLDQTEARGLRVFATLQGTPEWATSGSLFNGVPDDPRDWQDFCYRAARRYRGRIHAWGLWNEPNLERFWSGTRSQYIDEILIPGVHAIRAADADAEIAAADLAHLSSADWQDWLARVIRDAGSLIDVVVHHVYPGGSGHWEVTEDLDEEPAWPWDPPSVREVLNGNGWFDRPFWLTETGLESDDHGEASQARFYTGLLTDWFGPTRSRGWVARLFFYHIMDDPRFPSITFGILEAPPSMARKPAWDAYRHFIETHAVHDAELVAARVPGFLTPGDNESITLEFRNTGTTTWIGGDNTWLDVRIHPVLGQLTGGITDPGSTVAPGQTLTAEYQLAVDPVWTPTNRIEAPFFARLVGPDGWHFGDAAYRVITLHREAAPTIDRHPAAVEVVLSGSATFSVAARSDNWIAYQWRRNSVPLVDDDRVVGCHTPELRLTDVGPDLLGDYDCVVTNAAGSVASQPALLEPLRSARRPAPRLPASQSLLKDWYEFRYGVERSSVPFAPLESGRHSTGEGPGSTGSRVDRTVH
jgi:hypothetical protein